MLGLIVLGSFQWAIVAFLAIDIGLVWTSRIPSLRKRALLIGRGAAGLIWFSLEVIVFGQSVALAMGQGILLAAIALLVVGRGGEGKITAGIVCAVIAVALTFSFAFAQQQAKINELNEGIAAAFELATVGRAGEAVDTMELLIEQHPDSAWVRMAAAELFRSELIQDLNRAVVLADEAVDLASSDLKARAYIVLATVQEMRGEIGKAIASTSESIEAERENPLAYWIRARLHATSDRRLEAIEDLLKVEELSPGTDMAQSARLVRLQMQGDSPVRVTGPEN